MFCTFYFQGNCFAPIVFFSLGFGNRYQSSDPATEKRGHVNGSRLLQPLREITWTRLVENKKISIYTRVLVWTCVASCVCWWLWLMSWRPGHCSCISCHTQLHPEDQMSGVGALRSVCAGWWTRLPLQSQQFFVFRHHTNWLWSL